MAVQPVDAFAMATNKAGNVPSPAKKLITPSSAQDGAAPKPRSSASASVNSRKGNPEKRANHNAIERARRESLNNRFLILAASLPAISQIRRPSKSLIVNRSLQFVADSLSREVRYREMLKEQNSRQRALVNEVNELRARCGLTAERGIEAEPELELPKALTEVEKASSSRRPRSSSNVESLGDDNLNGDMLDDLDDFDDCGSSFPLPAGGLDAFSLSLTSAYSPHSSADGFDANAALAAAHNGYFVNHAQLAPVPSHGATTTSGAPSHQISLVATPQTNSPAPELSSSTSTSSGASICGPVDATGSPTSTVASHASPGHAALFDMAQPYPVMTPAAAIMHQQFGYQQQSQQQHGAFDANHHARAASFPQPQQPQHFGAMRTATGPHPHQSSAPHHPQQSHPQQQSHNPHPSQQQHPTLLHSSLPPASTTPPAATFDVGAYMAALQSAHAQVRQQQQAPQHQQQHQQFAAAAAYAASHPQQAQASAPLPSPFLAPPHHGGQGFMTVA